MRMSIGAYCKGSYHRGTGDTGKGVFAPMALADDALARVARQFGTEVRVRDARE